MIQRLLASVGVPAVVVAAGFLAQASAEGQVRVPRTQTQGAAVVRAWTPPKTSFGDPDLQGVWLNNSATPLERPEMLKGRLRLTNDEVAELKKRADRLFDDGTSDVALGDAVFLGGGAIDLVFAVLFVLAFRATRNGESAWPR